MASRPPTDRSAEAVARAFVAQRHAALYDPPSCECLTTEVCEHHAAKLLRARDAAWRRVVRQAKREGERLNIYNSPEFEQGYADACDRILAAAPGTRGTTGGRRGN